MIEFVEKIVLWFLSLPLFGIIGYMAGGFTLYLFKLYERKDGKNFLRRLKNISMLEVTLNEQREKQHSEAQKMEVQKQKLAEKAKLIEDKEEDLDFYMSKYDHMIQRWKNVGVSIPTKIEKVALERLLVVLSTPGISDKFVKDLKQFKMYVEKPANVTPTVIDDVKTSLNWNLTESDVQKYVMAVYDNRVGRKDNPILVAYELHMLYGRFNS